MLGFFKKKTNKEIYLEKVASILHQTMGAMLPLDNAHLLAEESLRELRDEISRGRFSDGPNPRENIMAYYSICTIIEESDFSNNKEALLNIASQARRLQSKLGEFESMSSLEKGTFQFGKLALSGLLIESPAADVEKIKSRIVQVIVHFMRVQEVAKIIQIPFSNVGSKEVLRVGENIFALSVLSFIIDYYIDQEKNDLAYSYYMCASVLSEKYINSNQVNSNSDYQTHALKGILDRILKFYDYFSSHGYVD